jgi:hypothetical protein
LSSNPSMDKKITKFKRVINKTEDTYKYLGEFKKNISS